MNKTKKLVLTGVVIGSLLTSGVTYAANQIKLVINGQQVSPSVPPQVINGTTMVPLRLVAESLNADVKYDPSTNTVYVNGSQSNVPTVSQKQDSGYVTIQDLTPYNQDHKMLIGGGFTEGKITIRQKEYVSPSNLRATSNGSGLITYIIDGKYESITGLLGVDDTSYYSAGKLVISDVDKDKVLYDSDWISKGEKPTNVDVDLTGVDTLEIHMWGPNSPDMSFFDIKLNKKK